MALRFKTTIYTNATRTVFVTEPGQANANLLLGREGQRWRHAHNKTLTAKMVESEFLYDPNDEIKKRSKRAAATKPKRGDAKKAGSGKKAAAENVTTVDDPAADGAESKDPAETDPPKSDAEPGETGLAVDDESETSPPSETKADNVAGRKPGRKTKK